MSRWCTTTARGNANVGVNPCLVFKNNSKYELNVRHRYNPIKRLSYVLQGRWYRIASTSTPASTETAASLKSSPMMANKLMELDERERFHQPNARSPGGTALADRPRFSSTSSTATIQHARYSDEGLTMNGELPVTIFSGDRPMLLDRPTRFRPRELEQPSERIEETGRLFHEARLFPEATIASKLREKQQSMSTAISSVNRLDLGLCLSYVSCAIGAMLPFTLLLNIATSTANVSSSSFVPFCVFLATVGGGIGKLSSGFVCQALGGKLSVVLYLTGMTLCAMTLSVASSPGAIGFAVATNEFASTMVWVACNIIMSKHYSGDKLRSSIVMLSLSSLTGNLLGKIGGAAFLQYFNWREVARFGALNCVFGVLVAQFLLRDLTDKTTKEHMLASSRKWSKEPLLQQKGGSSDQAARVSSGAVGSLKRVCGNPQFWLVGVAHAALTLGRTSDRILGAFLKDVTNMPEHICSGLTAAGPIGLVLGLVTGKKMDGISSGEGKLRFVARRYVMAVLSTLSLAGLGLSSVSAFVPPMVKATLILLCAGLLTYSVSHQFYTIPPLFSRAVFHDDQEVSISLLMSFGFLLGAPTWKLTGRIIEAAERSHGLGAGWPAAWVVLALCFGVGGILDLAARGQWMDGVAATETTQG